MYVRSFRHGRAGLNPDFLVLHDQLAARLQEPVLAGERLLPVLGGLCRTSRVPKRPMPHAG
jgi:hypothetical protein